ncbi:hypothetical protein DRP04_00255 [Archaeoglobales archaeon]|jgi:Rad3-related DNA helicase|nr:MAG: hypothetical protein DRP04_00255 [Archaeoglobales archaeon]
MIWGLYKDDRLQRPLKYSNGKTQADVVEDILDAFNSYDIVLLRGAVGTGKSAIAAHVAALIGGGKGIIVVPTKVLEQQYVEDYGGGRFSIILNDEKVRFAHIMGRSNFKCLYRQCSASNPSLPCTCPLTYTTSTGRVKRYSRVDLARRCVHWSPIVGEELTKTYGEKLSDAQQIHYLSVRGKKTMFVRDPCPFYKQFLYYAGDNIILMNMSIWEAETFNGRKPLTNIEIIDEGDLWLDSLTFERAISIKTIMRLIDLYEDDEDVIRKLEELLVNLTELLHKYDGYLGTITDDWREFLEEYCDTFDEIGREARIEPLLKVGRVYMSVDSGWERVRFFVPDLKSVLKSTLERCAKKILLMSATFQPFDVLKDVYGIDDIGIVEGETRFPGTVFLKRTGKESYVSHKRWQNEEFRKKYHKCLDEILKKAKRPLLVHVHAKKYLPDNVKLDCLKDASVFREEFDEVWSTIAKRGLDLRGDRCRSICILKYPFPDLSDGMLQAIRLLLGDDAFFRYYRDKADRELIQQIGRAVRSKDDWVEVWSPDLTVHMAVRYKWKGKLIADTVLDI